MTTTTIYYANAGAPIGSVYGVAFALAPGNTNTPSGPVLTTPGNSGSASTHLIAPMGSVGHDVNITAPVAFFLTGDVEVSGSVPSQATFTVALQLFNTDNTVKQTLGSNSVTVPVQSGRRYVVPIQLSISVPITTVFTMSDIIGFTVTVTTQNAGAFVYSGSGSQTTMTVTTAPAFVPIPIHPITPNHDNRDRTILIIVIVIVAVLILAILLIIIIHSASDHGPRRARLSTN